MDPRNQKMWFVQTYWTGPVGPDDSEIPQSDDTPRRFRRMIEFVHPANLFPVTEAYPTEIPTFTLSDALSDRELMDLLDKARARRLYAPEEAT